uniref:Uncharacterized protein n=1 Tax=Oreochromis aureus TaxID=47969 RepID=A0A668VY90_OREAU
IDLLCLTKPCLQQDDSVSYLFVIIYHPPGPIVHTEFLSDFSNFLSVLVLSSDRHNQAPPYLNELVVPYQPIRALRSCTPGLLVVPRVFKSKWPVFKSRTGGRPSSC